MMTQQKGRVKSAFLRAHDLYRGEMSIFEVEKLDLMAH